MRLIFDITKLRAVLFLAVETEEWSIEGLGPNSLFRKGWRPDSFNPGDVIEIKFNPMQDGSKAGGFIGARFANGSTIGNW